MHDRASVDPGVHDEQRMDFEITGGERRGSFGDVFKTSDDENDEEDMFSVSPDNGGSLRGTIERFQNNRLTSPVDFSSDTGDAIVTSAESTPRQFGTDNYSSFQPPETPQSPLFSLSDLQSPLGAATAAANLTAGKWTAHLRERKRDKKNKR